ncbi:MAG: hypothetical protein WDN03_12215 [Rhizomicrobium sp.]
MNQTVSELYAKANKSGPSLAAWGLILAACGAVAVLYTLLA